MFIVALLSSAAAFCGTYVSTGDAPSNEGSFVSIVRQGTSTTLTLANDATGDVADFALVIPVPEVLAESAIHVVDPAIFAHINAYSGARLVSYTCEDFAPDTNDSADTDSDTDSDSDLDTGGTTVEAQYVVGEYDVTLLSSTESGSLVSWLQDHGYAVPTASETLLGEYIDGGSYFLAAQVRPGSGVESGDLLSPLQLTYTETGIGLPIRLGTLNSAGRQDLTIYGITSSGSGGLAISNYPESTLETDCMLEDGEGLADHVDTLVDDALPLTGEAHWVNEYTWDNGGCDPCTPDGTLTETDLTTLGFDPDSHYGYNYTFSRLHMRYAPGQITQDLALYATGIAQTKQLRFIDYNAQLEDLFPVCGVGFVDDPGSCEDDSGETGDSDAAFVPTGGAGCGCGSGGGAGALGLIAVAGIFGRRRITG